MASERRGVVSSSRRGASKLVNKVVREVEMELIKKRLMRAEKFLVRLKAKEEDGKFKFSKTGCEKQFEFNIKMKDRFGIDLKTELESCFEEKLPAGVKSLVEEVEKEIDEQNVKLKVADEFGFEVMEDFSKEDLARNKEEERKIKIFRKEKRDREEKTVKKIPFGVRGEVMSRRRKGYRKALYDRCYSCFGVGHIAADCVRQGSGRGSKRDRR